MIETANIRRVVAKANWETCESYGNTGYTSNAETISSRQTGSDQTAVGTALRKVELE